MNRVILYLVMSFLLISCGAKETPISPSGSGSTGETRSPYIVSTLKLSDTMEKVKVEKTGRIISSSSLTLTSQGAGEISKILVKEGQKVKAGATIAVLKDTVNNFDLRLAQAENSIALQEATITTTKVNLEQSVENARIGYKRAEQAYTTVTQKNALQYDTTVNSNNKTLESYNQNYRSYLMDTERLMTQLLYEGDKILGMSTNFEYANDGWEAYLGVRNGSSYADAKNEWDKTYALRGTLRAKLEKSTYIKPDTLDQDLALIGSGYIQLQRFADAMLLMNQNNVVGAGLSQDMQNGWISTWNGLKASVQGSETGYNAWKGQTLSFFRSYKNSEIAQRLALESLTRELTPDERALIDGSLDLRVTYESLRLSLRDAVTNAKLALDQAKLALDNAEKIKSATLEQLDVSRKNTQIALDQARRDYAKLSISAPIEGTVTKVLANVGQTINAGSMIAEFAGKHPQIVVDIDSSLASTLMVGDTVSVSVESHTLTGKISALSNISNANLLSTVRITLENAEKYIGKSATMTFFSVASTKSDTLLLPINAVKIISEDEGEISIVSGSGVLEKQTVKLGRIGDINIEVIGKFEKNDLLITSDMNNYDPSKNTLIFE